MKIKEVLLRLSERSKRREGKKRRKRNKRRKESRKTKEWWKLGWSSLFCLRLSSCFRSSDRHLSMRKDGMGVDVGNCDRPYNGNRLLFWARNAERTVPIDTQESVNGSDKIEPVERGRLGRLFRKKNPKPETHRKQEPKKKKKKMKSRKSETEAQEQSEIQITRIDEPNESTTNLEPVGSTSSATTTTGSVTHRPSSPKPPRAVADLCQIFSLDCRKQNPASKHIHPDPGEPSFTTSKADEEGCIVGKLLPTTYGFAILLFLLLSLLVGGRFFAIVCTSIGFYILPILQTADKKSVVPIRQRRGKEKAVQSTRSITTRDRK